VKVTDFRDVKPYNLIEGYHCFRGTGCLLLEAAGSCKSFHTFLLDYTVNEREESVVNQHN